MGVRGLQFYLEQCCKPASPSIDIKRLADNYRSKRGNEEPVIVVDGSNCIRTLYGELEWVGGGQLKQFGEKAQHFVQAFEEIGVRLVFYFDGPTIEKKRPTWVDRRLRTLESMYHVLDEISSGKPSSTIPEKYFHLPPGLGQLSRVIFQVICGCEVIQSLTECDEEIAEYARSYGALAILGQDSDYVILDCGQSYYLSMKHLNLDNMTTLMYDRWELARRLRIHPSHLPLLATFMGNDVVTSDELKPFHLQITKQTNSNRNINFRVLVPCLAGYIRSLPLDPEYLHNRDLLANIAQQVLGDYSRDKDIRASLRSYDSRLGKDYGMEDRRALDPWSQLVAEARKRHVTNQFPSMIYAIMSGLPFESSTSIEDFRKQDIPTFASATQPIRERVYGILLQEKPLSRGQQVHMVKEWCMAGPDSLNEAKLVQAVPPQPRHPGLLALWEDTRYLDVRWQLFVNSISPNLDVDKVRYSLPAYLVVPTLILFFIKERYRDCLADWEIDAVLATAASLKHYSAASLTQVPSDPISSRGVRVANLVMRSTFVLYFLLAACGYPIGIQQSAPWLFFDGKLFQMKYKQAELKMPYDQLCERKVDVLEDFQSARQIVLSSTF